MGSIIIGFSMKNFLIIVLLLFAGATTWSQEPISTRQLFENAEFYLFDSEYAQAARIYETLLENDENNKNLCFHLALCYINMPDENKKAIYYLKKIFSNTTISSYQRENDYFLYLGKLYHIDFPEEQPVNNGFKLDPNKPYKNLALSGDGKTLVFLNSQSSENRIYYTIKEGNIWSEAKEITEQIGSNGDCFPSSLTYDGKKLYLTKFDNFESDIYETTFNGKTWSSMRKPNGNINSTYWETHACESPDGQVLYFASNRKGGFGGMDIYFSNKVKGEWDKPVNAGVRINTFLNDDYPLLTNNGTTLIYSSQGFKKGKDGYDLYYCTRTWDNIWTEPINIGFPVNSSEDDLTYVPLTEESQAFFNLILLNYQKSGSENKSTKSTFLVGTVCSRETKKCIANAEVQIINNTDGSVLSTVTCNSEGQFKKRIEQGDYSFKISSNNKIIKVANFYIPFITREDTINMNIYIEDKPYANLRVSENNQGLLTKGNASINEIEQSYGIGDKQSKKKLNSKNDSIALTADTNKNADLKEPEGITIQLHAMRNFEKELDYSGVDSIAVYKCNDGIFRYVYGVFKTEAEALPLLEKLKSIGHSDAFTTNLIKFRGMPLVYSKKFN